MIGGFDPVPESALPRDLAPWRQELDLFPAELVVTLQGSLRRLRGLIGSLTQASLAGRGDPDGYQDLARRGPYERLLASEWLLAEEAPEEFDRRAVMGEHLFLELARRSPRPRGRSLALFDVGPDQLGGPRIAQLALLILLAGRSRTAGMPFFWGLVQRPEQGRIGEVTEASVQGFLEGRSADRVTIEHLEAWRRSWGEIEAVDDLWLVGGERLTRSAPVLRASAVTVEDVLEPGRRTLRVRARRAGGRAREVELDLPGEADCARLLRDPFSIVVPVPVRSGTGPARGGLRFAAGGDRVLVRTAAGVLVAHHVPTSPDRERGRTRRLSTESGEELVAGGYRGGSLLGATLNGHVLTLHGVPWAGQETQRGGKLLIGLPPDIALTPAAAGGPIGLCHLVAQGAPHVPPGRGRLMALVDPTGQVVELAPRHFETLIAPGARVVAADGTLDSLLMIVEEPATVPGAVQWRAIDWRGSSATVVLRRAVSRAAELRAVFGHGEQSFAVAVDDETWTVRSRHGESERDLRPGAGARPVAAAWGPDGAGLVILEDDRRTFSLVGLRRSKILLRAGGEVNAAAGCRARAIFGYVTTSGELTVCEIDSRRSLLRLVPGEGE